MDDLYSRRAEQLDHKKVATMADSHSWKYFASCERPSLAESKNQPRNINIALLFPMLVYMVNQAWSIQRRMNLSCSLILK